MVLGTPDAQRLVNIVCTGCAPLLAWYAECYASCESADHSQKWLLDQLGGALMRHVDEIMITASQKSAADA